HALGHFVKYSVATTMYRFPSSVTPLKGSTISILTLLKGASTSSG
ncbi:2248_t:CDS:1, partial [Gigaspora rosea]